MTPVDPERAGRVAREAASAAAAAALARFSPAIEVELKPDRSPVTAADRDAEAAVIDVIRTAFPGHSILGEESGPLAGDPARRWIVDPLDGTRGFTRGGSFWGPLVAFEEAGRIVAGAMALPVAGELYYAARGHGSWLERRGETPRRLRVSAVGRWSEATLSLGELHVLLAPPHATAVVALATSAAQARCHGDLAACAMLLRGEADVFLEAGVREWDLAPFPVLVEEAGGRVTDWGGGPSVAAGFAVASNGLLHGHVLAALNPR